MVVTHNSAAHLDRLLESFPRGLGDQRARLVFVDNASADDTVARLRRRGGHEVLAQPDNRGYAASINVGMAATRDAAAVLVLNPDLSLGPGSIPALMAAGREPGVGIVVPQIRTPAGALYPSLRREPTVGRALGTAVLGGRVAGRFARLSETVTDERRYRHRDDVDWATGAAMLVTRRCADTVGRWDESFFLYSEETDFAHRAREVGFRVLYEPAAVVTHTGGQAETSPRLRSMLVVNRVRYFRRRHGRLPSAAFYAAVLWNELTRAALGNRAALTAARGLVSRRARPRELVPCQATFARFTASQGRRWQGRRRKAHTLRCGDDEDAASGVPGRREARPMLPDTALSHAVDVDRVTVGERVHEPVAGHGQAPLLG